MKLRILKDELKSLQESQQKSLEQIKEMSKEDNEIQALKDEFRILKEDIRKKAWGEYLDVAKTRSPFLSKKKL